MHRGFPFLILVRFALVVVLISSGQARVAAARVADDRSARVQVTLVRSAAQTPEFSELVEEWLTANGVSHVIREASSVALDDIKQARGSGPPVRIWVVVPSREMLQIYLAAPDERRYLVRNVPLPNGFDELGRERAAQVVLSSALAFMERRAASSLDDVERALQATRTPPGEPALAAPPTPDRAVRRRPQSRPMAFAYGLGAFYGLSYPTELVHGPGGLLFAQGSEPPWSVRVLLRAQYHWQRTIETERIRVSERGAALSLGGALLRELGPAWQLYVEFGAGADRVLTTPEALPGSGVEPRGSGRHLRPFVTGMLGALWHTEHLELDLLVGCSAYTLTTRYVVNEEGDSTRELTRARFQPGLLMDVIWGSGLVTQRER
jgi:hypothetical protein